MTFNKLSLACALCGCLLTSCSTFNPQETANEWDVVKIGTTNIVQGPHSPYIGFDKDRIYGFTGCNRINGGIEIDGKNFSAKHVSTTMMLCPDARYEEQFLKALSDAEKIEPTEQGFSLLNKDGQTVMDLAPRTLDVATLNGQWLLTQMNGKEIPSNEETPFLLFNIEEKLLSGFAGCNRINSPLDLDALRKCTVDFTHMAMTRKFCENNVVEADFIAGINAAKTIKVNDGKLYIYSENENNSLVFEKEN